MWKIEFLPEAAREVDKLDRQHAKRILKFLNERVSKLHDPRTVGAALKGSRFGGYWKYRVGDYRIISKIEEDQLIILVVRVAHRRQAYR
jgi:mRNA interferase RelE/StbE